MKQSRIIKGLKSFRVTLRNNQQVDFQAKDEKKAWDYVAMHSEFGFGLNVNKLQEITEK